MQTREKGFTLIEIAIVLVIIGLLLGGVLKGQAMIDSAKTKNLVNDMKAVSAAYYAYQDLYRSVPGDDGAAATRFPDAVNGGGDGAIAGLYNADAAPSPSAESNNFWQHTRMAGLLNGTVSAGAAPPPTHALGGLLGVQSQAGAAGGSSFGLVGPVVCAGAVPWKIAQSVDVQIDDGDSATGNVRAGGAGTGNQPTTAATAAVYGPAVTITAEAAAGMHTVCMKI